MNHGGSLPHSTSKAKYKLQTNAPRKAIIITDPRVAGEMDAAWYCQVSYTEQQQKGASFKSTD